MNTTQMIECANIKSTAYKGLNKRSTQNASWENAVNIDLLEGDQLSIENAIINIRGISSDSTVEILGEDTDNGISDSKVGMRFSPYVNDNGINTVALPIVCSNVNIEYPLTYNNQNVNKWPELDDTHTNTDANLTWNGISVAQTNPNDNTAPYNAMEPVTAGEEFVFSYGGNVWHSAFGSNCKTYYTENAAYGEWNTVSGHKYTLMDPNYRGPFRSDDQGNFHSAEGDCKPWYFDLKVDVNGPLYESPSTIADSINQQLNTTNVYGDNDLNPTFVNDKKQTVTLPALSGPLLHVKNVNGVGHIEDDNQKLWGNIGFRDIKKFMGVDALYHADLAFDCTVNYNDSMGPYKLYQPCFLMPNGEIDGSIFYPRISKTLTYKFSLTTNTSMAAEDLLPGTGTVYYSTLPQYYLFTTNMKYNEANIKRIQTYMRNTEKYDGVSNDPDTDIENWRSHWDIGFSRCAGGNRSATKEMYFCAHGNFNLPIVVAGQAPPTIETQYAHSWPYHPFEDKFETMSTSRSDIPDVGYTQMIPYGDDVLFGLVVGLYNIKKIEDPDVPHRFKDNKNKDASIAFYSKYDSSWQSKIVTDGMSNISFGDDSLSSQYNVGCYPVNIRSHSGPDPLYDLTDTYWVGCANNVPENMKYAYPCPTLDFLYYIGPGHDDDHKLYGGYSLYIYEDFPVAGWVV